MLVWKEFAAKHRGSLLLNGMVSWGINPSFTRYLVKYPGGDDEGLKNEYEEAYHLINKLIECRNEGLALTPVTMNTMREVKILEQEHGIRLPGRGTSRSGMYKHGSFLHMFS